MQPTLQWVFERVVLSLSYTTYEGCGHEHVVTTQMQELLAMDMVGYDVKETGPSSSMFVAPYKAAVIPYFWVRHAEFDHFGGNHNS